MLVLDRNQTYEALAKALGKWLVVAGPFPEGFDPQGSVIENILAAVPWLNLQQHAQAIADGVACAVCDSMEEALRAFDAVYGDDNANQNEQRSGVGDVRIYAVLIDPTRGIVNENT